jgi:hypothetical protein
MAALTIAALGSLDSNRPRVAGLLGGAIVALKPTGIPILVVLIVLASRIGPRAGVRYAVAAAASVALLLGPVLIRDPTGLWNNVLAFPLGLTDIQSPAQSPFIGVLLANSGSAGKIVALALMAGAAVASALILWMRPPTTTRAAARFLATTLTIAFILAPASRAGYLVLPLLVAGFVEVVARQRAS